MPHEKLPQEDDFWAGEDGEVYYNDECGTIELDEVQIVDGLNEGSRLRTALAQRDARIAELEKDRERLDWMQQMNSEVFWINAKLCEVTLGLTVGSGEADDLRSAIDAALDAAKGETIE